MIAVLVSVGLMPYLAGIMFYHSHRKRAVVALNDWLLSGMRLLAWALLLGSFYWTAALFGPVRGIFYQAFADALILLSSVLFGTRWPRLHWWSGVSAAPLFLLLLVA
ncbi:MAG: hypothetical protein AAF662_05640 [Pseudomonadota bacterium]